MIEKKMSSFLIQVEKKETVLQLKQVAEVETVSPSFRIYLITIPSEYSYILLETEGIITIENDDEYELLRGCYR